MPLFSFPSGPRFSFDWHPKPWAVGYQLVELQERFEDTLPLAESAREIAKADIAEHFYEERDPEGVPWEPLVRPAENQIGILRLTETMFQSATADNAWEVMPDGVFFRVDVLPDYWIFHQEPSKRLPQRKFIGLSADAEAQIVALADEFLGDVIDYSVSGPSVQMGTIRGVPVAIRRTEFGFTGGLVGRAYSGKYAKL